MEIIRSLYSVFYTSGADNKASGVENKGTPISRIPPEIVHEIFLELSLKDIAIASLASRKLQDISNDNYLWTIIFIRTFNPDKKVEDSEHGLEDMELIYEAKMNFREKVQAMEKDLEDLNAPDLPESFNSINLHSREGQRVFFHLLRQMTKALTEGNSGPTDSPPTVLKIFNAVKRLDKASVYDQNALIEDLRRVAEKSPKALAENIHLLGIEDQSALIELAMQVAEKTPTELAQNIQNFGIQDQSKLIEIAWLYADKDPECLAINFQHFGIQDQNEALKFAEYMAKRHPRFAACYIQNFGIQDQKDIIKIANILAEDVMGAWALSDYIHLFGIQDQNALVDLVKKCFEKNSLVAAENIQRFGLQGQNDLIYLAKILAALDPNSLSKHIQKFGIQSQDALIDIAVIAFNKNPYITRDIANFGIQDQNALIANLKRGANANMLKLIDKHFG